MQLWVIEWCTNGKRLNLAWPGEERLRSSKFENTRRKFDTNRISSWIVFVHCLLKVFSIMRCWTVTIILDLWLLSSFQKWINWTREQIPKFTGSTNKWSIPEVFLVNTFGNDRIPVSWLRRRLFMDGDNIDMKLLKHSGAMPCNNLKRMSFLYSLRYHTGSRYNSRSRGVLYCNYNNKPQ